MKLNIGYGRYNVLVEQNLVDENGLARAFCAIGDIPYEIVGIDTCLIRKNVVKGDIEATFSNISKIVKSNSAYKEYGPLIESIAIDEFLEIMPKHTKVEGNAEKDKVYFVSNGPEWIIIKKMSISKETKAREVAAFLLGIKYSLLTKYLDNKSCSPDALDSVMGSIKGKRRSISALATAYNSSKGDKIAFLKGILGLGYSITPTADAIKSVFPEVKLPGIKGRMPKK
ncbi:MAG: hypothetical protein ACP5H8_02710 [Candidatus Micrarchaeia archaeon]